ALKGAPLPASDSEAGVVTTSADVADAAVDAGPPAPTHHHSHSKAPPPVEAGKPEPTICAVGHGAHLPSDEAEKRAAQVEVLKRINVLDQDEYDCLRKAYLERL
ncbi:MAG: hypothetical protein ACRELY_09695, partial [Polyangiaceae bacterium]